MPALILNLLRLRPGLGRAGPGDRLASLLSHWLLGRDVVGLLVWRLARQELRVSWLTRHCTQHMS